MSLALRKDIETQLNNIDPVGAKVRKLRRRLTTLEKKGNITASEYKELSSGFLKLKDLQQQRKDIAAFESALDPKVAKMLRISKAYDKITEQYDAGKVDEDIYAGTLRKLWNRLNEGNEQPLDINVTVRDYGPVGTNLLNAFEQGCAAFIVIMILIPILFSCSLHS
jgi:hypothetical protein